MTYDPFKDIEPELERQTAEYLGEAPLKPLPMFDLALLGGAEPEARQWILPDYIPAGEITLFTGPGGAGKSLFAQQMATCLAGAVPFLGMATTGAKTLYVTAEDDNNELHRRQRNILRSIGLVDLSGKLFLSSLRGRLGNELATFDRDGELERTKTFYELRDTITMTGAKLIILDNVAHLFTGNENDRGQVTRFVNLLYSLVKEYGVSIVLIGHPNKSGDAYSGSTAWLNAVRSQIEINRIRDGDGAVLDPDARALNLGKANYARAGTELHFRWHEFAFVLDADLPPDTRAEMDQAIKANGENTAFLNCLRARAEQGEGRYVGPSSGPNYAPSQFEGMAQAKGYRRTALKRAMDRLFSIGAIETHTYRNTSKGRDVTIIREVAQ